MSLNSPGHITLILCFVGVLSPVIEPVRVFLPPRSHARERRVATAEADTTDRKACAHIARGAGSRLLGCGPHSHTHSVVSPG